MLETMYVRCTHCGYDNSPEYRFCGMCGASLARPAAAEPKAPVRQAATPGNGGEQVPVHGPSFLGLAEDPKTEFHYLYEDEPQHSHVGLIVFLLIIFGAAGFLGWQWKQGGFPFNRTAAPAANSPTTGAQQSASPSEVAPAMNQNQEAHENKPVTGGSQPAQPEQKTQNESGKAGPAEEDLPPASGSQPTAENAAPENKTQENTSEENATEEAKATPPAPAPAKTAGAPKRTTKPAAPVSAPKPASPDADLEQAGERYLYGNGVPQNCTRAESSLRTAAMHGNTKAQTVLGTMYATGHCVGRDLPTAYRWFARALHQEPQNSRISADLQVLWRQMTPQEKQLATTSRD